MAIHEAIESAAEALAAGDQRLASDRYETAAQLFLDEGDFDAAAIHLMLAARYAGSTDDRPDGLMLRAQALYSTQGNDNKVHETLLGRASRAAQDGPLGKAEQLYTECISHAAERLATIARDSLAVQGPLSADPEADVLIDHISHSRIRIQQLRES